MIEIFLSQSFRKEDAEIANLVRAIAEALDLKCRNVDRGSSSVPADEARKLIGNAEGLIGIAVRRNRVSGGYDMPQAVREEVAFAYSMRKPMLVLMENKVQHVGFMGNMATTMPFDRKDLAKPHFLQKLVSSLDNFKQSITSARSGGINALSARYYATKFSALIELVRTRRGYEWHHAYTRHLIFTADLQQQPIPVRVWPSVRVSTSLRTRREFDAKVEGGNRNFKLKIDKEISPSGITGLLHLTPSPRAGDSVIISSIAKSNGINPVYRQELGGRTGLVVAGSRYRAFDGITPLQATHELSVRMRFPKGFPIALDDIEPFAAHHTVSVNFTDQNEIQRCDREVESLGGNIDAMIHVRKPTVGYLYGIAWNPPSRPR